LCEVGTQIVERTNRDRICFVDEVHAGSGTLGGDPHRVNRVW
jgi:hypothetical protein